MNTLAQYLRAEVALVSEAKRLGRSHIIDHDKGVLICRRAAEEIERLVGLLDHVQKIALMGFQGEMDEDQALSDINNLIVAEMKARAENPS